MFVLRLNQLKVVLNSLWHLNQVEATAKLEMISAKGRREVIAHTYDTRIASTHLIILECLQFCFVIVEQLSVEDYFACLLALVLQESQLNLG